MKLIFFTLLAMASTLSVSCLQCYDCGSPIMALLPAAECFNRTSTCEGSNTTCISITQVQANQTLITRRCAPDDACKNLQTTNTTTCIPCYTDLCNNGTIVPRNGITTTTTEPILTTTTPNGQSSNGTTTTVKPVVTTTTPKAQPTKKKNSASSVGSNLAVLILAVVLQYKLN